MSIFLVVRHTRADEEAGRVELVGSAAVGRLAPLTAALLVAVAANVALTAAAVRRADLPRAAGGGLGRLRAGHHHLRPGLRGGGGGTAQLAAARAHGPRRRDRRARRRLPAPGRGRRGRAGGPAWLSWLSPLGWTEFVRPYTADRWWVLALPLALTAAAVAAAYTLAVRRDHGAGLLPDRPGRPTASGALRGPLGLAWRLQRGTLAAGRPASRSPSPPAGRRPRASAPCSAAARSSGRPSPGWAGRPGSPTPTWPRSCRWPGWPPRPTPPRRCSGCAGGDRRPGRAAAGHGGRPDPVGAQPRRRRRGRIGPAAPGGGGGRTRLRAAHRIGRAEVARLLGAALVQLPASLMVAGAAVALFGLLPGSRWPARVSARRGRRDLLVRQVLRLSAWMLDLPVDPRAETPRRTVSGAPLLWLCLAAVAFPCRGRPGRAAPPRHRLMFR